jgi:hypothetical protein
VHVESFDSAPARDVGAGAAETFSDKGTRIGDVGETRVHGEGAGVIDEIVYGLCVGV